MKRISAQEFLEIFNPSVHAKIAARLREDKSVAVVCFQTADLSASRVLSSALGVGPNNTFHTVADTEGRYIGDLPSQRQYAESWADAAEVAALADKTEVPPEPPVEYTPTEPVHTVEERTALAATANAATVWLKSLGPKTVENAAPCIVCIGKQVWPAVAYDSVNFYTEGMTAVQNGEHKAGEKYSEPVLYVIGPLPKSYGNRRVCYPKVVGNPDWYNRRVGKSQDWYVSGHYQELNPKFAEHHPFGKEFTLRYWDLPEPIDAGAVKPYTRIELVVESLPLAVVA